ncbi:MAG: SAM-dependent methyltransferase [Candidatus Electrothrix sp. ATG2]|nr:SAM-dependent methyltransferase [Candidatus Electrothrix sp. ATG2]
MAKPIPRDLLICPLCRTERLSFHDNKKILCQQCGKHYGMQDGNKYYFIDSPAEDQSFLGNIKERLKGYPRLYRLLIELVSPVCPTSCSKQNKLIKRMCENNREAVIVNLGSGSSNISAKVSNVDIFPYKNVDMICDIGLLPFKDESVDMILNSAVLEHVPNPEQVVSEILRVLKPGGVVYCFFPFMQGFHASPYDYSRRTESGLLYLFKDLDIMELSCAGGPTSGLLWIFQEWLAITLSFGSTPLYNVLHLLAMLILWPVKFLDVLLVHHPQAKNISSGFVVIARK